MVIRGSDFEEDIKVDIKRDFRGDIREKFEESIFLALDKSEMDFGWVGMTQVGSNKVRTSRWTPRQRSSGTTGGHQGVLQ